MKKLILGALIAVFVFGAHAQDQERTQKTPEEIAEANKPIVPQVISRRQFKLALAFLGYNENDILNGGQF